MVPIELKSGPVYIDRAELITDLTTALNTGLRTTVLNDGRFIGLALADEMVQAMAKVPSAFGVANIKDAACAVALPACTDATMVSGAASNTPRKPNSKPKASTANNSTAGGISTACFWIIG